MVTMGTFKILMEILRAGDTVLDGKLVIWMRNQSHYFIDRTWRHDRRGIWSPEKPENKLLFKDMETVYLDSAD